MARPAAFLLALTMLSIVTSAAIAAPPSQVSQILYGASYYSEYLPSELGAGRVQTDVSLMKRAGINVVRMGESSWGCSSLRTDTSISRGWIAQWLPSARPGSG